MREILLKRQLNRCGLCGIDLSETEPRNVCVDHCHKQGHVRAALCRNCNGIEGKIFNLANRGKRGGTVPGFLQKLLKYWVDYAEGDVFHPDHKTEDEKRIKRNTKARLARAKKAATTNVKGK